MNVGFINVVLTTAFCFLTYHFNLDSNSSSFCIFHTLIFAFNYVIVMSVRMMATLKFLQLCASVGLMVVGVMLISAESTILVYFNRVPPARSRSSNAVFQYLVETLDGSNACRRNSCSFECEVRISLEPFFEFICSTYLI